MNEVSGWWRDALFCVHRTRKKMIIKIDRKKREDETVSSSAGKKGTHHRCSFLLFHVLCAFYKRTVWPKNVLRCFTTQELRIILAYAALFDILRILILLW
jgi:hypothetical protein